MIYMLEDDENIRNFVIYALRNSGFEAVGFEHPDDFWNGMAKEKPELLLLDIMLPDEDGISILKKIRSNPKTSALPIIMLTAKGTEYDKVVGLDSGADDYISKPFGTMELISRIRSLLRRTGEKQMTEYVQGPLKVDVSRHLVMVKDRNVELTYKEFSLLLLLLESKGAVLTRDEILSRIWGYDFDGESRTVDVHVRTLRGKLGEAGSIVETVRGVGYRLGGADE
ncbi:MAG: response regulator transcription factor [Eubacteriales bacterium]|nr:response regulator transcription factor [Eubacteriales bacterium]